MNDQAQVKGFDIDSLDSTDGPVTHKVSVIDDEDGNSVSGFIIVGKDSKECQDATRQIRINNIKRAAKRKSQLDSATDAGAALIAKTVDEADRMTAMSVVIGWYGFIQEGALIRFDKTLVAKMLDKKPQWQAKILNALEEEANFTKP